MFAELITPCAIKSPKYESASENDEPSTETELEVRLSTCPMKSSVFDTSEASAKPCITS